jgi:hypothetical protein
MLKSIISVFTLVVSLISFSQEELKIARLKYNGGGDWYASPTSLPNLARFCNEEIGTLLALEEAVIDISSPEIFSYPFVHMTGHGNVIFNNTEAKNLRNYLLSGGFLSINDSYGMDQFIRIEMKKVFPESDFIELPFDHPIYKQTFKFQKGLPKVHEHDGKSPRGYGILYEGRLVVFYNFECDLGDGWEDPQVHNDKAEVRTEALKMGANLIQFAFTTE